MRRLIRHEKRQKTLPLTPPASKKEAACPLPPASLPPSSGVMAYAFALLARLRIWPLLLLAAIGVQAAEPIRAPLERVQGSAFSASTLDVALGSARRVQSHLAAPAQPLPLPPVAAANVATATTRFAIAPSAHQRPEARGPPPRGHPARLPDSTAPPIA